MFTDLVTSTLSSVTSLAWSLQRDKQPQTALDVSSRMSGQPCFSATCMYVSRSSLKNILKRHLAQVRQQRSLESQCWRHKTPTMYSWCEALIWITSKAFTTCLLQPDNNKLFYVFFKHAVFVTSKHKRVLQRSRRVFMVMTSRVEIAVKSLSKQEWSASSPVA